MSIARVIIFVCFAAIIGVPVLFRPDSPVELVDQANALQLIIATPHNEQIRYEYSRAFSRWHERNFGRPVQVVFNVPGGTSEIRKMLESQFTAALESGQPPGGNADLVFGGGTREHANLKRGVRIMHHGVERYEPISTPVDFPDEWLQEIYGDGRIADEPLFDQDKHWFGLALSLFGIVYNRDNLVQLGIDEPNQWNDLADPRLRGWVALVNPGQSGSIASAFESILKREGWHEGWAILRRAGANARYFSGSSLKPPIDVSMGNAALGVCIDFYGRYQAQAMAEAGDPERVDYVDPPGGSTVDPDPISLLRNAPHPETARRFIEFCLSEQGQALWQFRARRENPSSDELGPEKYELRRLPIRRVMYEKHFGRLIDQVNPYALATPPPFPSPHFRDFVAPMFAAMVMDSHQELKDAWRAIVSHPAYPASVEIVMAGEVNDPTLKQMLELFDAFPQIEGPNGAVFSLENEDALGDIRAGWLGKRWLSAGLWHAEDAPADVMRRHWGEFFRAQYRAVVDLSNNQ